MAALVAWLAVCAASGVALAWSRGALPAPALPVAALALAHVAAPALACGIGAALGCALVLAKGVELARWPRRLLRAAAALLVAWLLVAALSLPAASAGLPVPLLALSAAFHSFPVPFVLAGFGCGVALAPLRARDAGRRPRISSPFSADEAPRRNAWRAPAEDGSRDAGEGDDDAPRGPLGE